MIRPGCVLHVLATLAVCSAITVTAPNPARAETAAAVQIVPFGAAARQSAGLVVENATTGTLARPIDAMGQIMSPRDRMVTIQPAGSGRVLTVNAVQGQHVTAGQVLLTYQDHSLHLVRLQMAKARAGLSTAQATRIEAQAAYARARALTGQSISVGETKRRLAVAQAAQDDVAAREADLATLRHQLDEEYNSVTEADNRSESSDDETSRILTPVAGEVQSLSVAVTDDIEPTSVVATIADLSHVWIASDVLPEDAARIDPSGMQESRLPDGTMLRSPILSVASMADPTTGLVRVLSRADNSAGLLRPGAMLDTQLPAREVVRGIVLPAEAVVSIAGQNAVFVPAGEGKFRLCPVRLGLETPDRAVILSGLQPGQPVVTHGAFALKATMLMAASGPDGD